MKNAKFMLIALTLFVAVGATLAFKAKTSVFNWCYTTREIEADLCTTYLCPLYAEQKRTIGAIAIYATSEIEGSYIDESEDCLNRSIICVKVPTIIDN